MHYGTINVVGMETLKNDPVSAAPSEYMHGAMALVIWKLRAKGEDVDHLKRAFKYLCHF